VSCHFTVLHYKQLLIQGIKYWENYSLTLQTGSYLVSSLTNYQRLDSDPLNYQNISKRSILSKHAFNALDTCHFSIK
jgi:hypothetical protein